MSKDANFKTKDSKQNNKKDFNSNRTKSNANNGRGGKYNKNRKGRSKEVEVNIDDSRINMADLDRNVHPIKGHGSKDNDWQWYGRYGQLLKDSSNLFFANPVGIGMKDRFVQTMDDLFTQDYTYNYVPGIMTINWSPTIGTAEHQDSVINLAARKLYSTVRYANSGSSNYTAPDLMMYIMAMDSAYAIYARLVRLYGTLKLYTPMNRYYPRALVKAQGFNFDNALSQIAQLRYAINQMSYKLQTLCVPSGMSLFERHLWLNSDFFVDSESEKAQTYIFRQKGYYQYVVDASQPVDLVARLQYKTFPDTMTIQQAITISDNIIDPLIRDETMGIMSGDLLKAFGRDNMFEVAPIAEEYTVTPVYSLEVLSQIQNLTVMGEFLTSSTAKPGGVGNNDIVQKINKSNYDDGIYQQISTTTFTQDDGNIDNRMYISNLSKLDRVITMYKDNPSAADIMVSTRLTAIADTFQVGVRISTSPVKLANIMHWSAVPTEVVHSIDIISMADNATTGVPDIVTTSVAANYIYPESSGDYRFIRQLEAFDYHPMLSLVRWETSKFKVFGNLVDYNNFTIIGTPDLRRMHEVALISEFELTLNNQLVSRPNNSR